MEASELKRSVVDSYGKLANARGNGLLSKLFACCNSGDLSNQVAKTIGYSEEQLAQVPQDSNLGVGCGNPSALGMINEGETVVDLGSGAGFDAFIVAHIVGESGKVIGVDLSEDMLSLARKNASQGNYEHVKFKKGDIEDLPLGNEIADHVISNCVINLSLKKGVVYKEAYRVLKEGGKLSISDVVLEKALPDFVTDSLAGHIACVSGAEPVEDYIQYVKDAGFKNVVIESKSKLPLELILSDPQVRIVAKRMNFDLSSEEAKDLASRVSSISLSAIK